MSLIDNEFERESVAPLFQGELILTARRFTLDPRAKSRLVGFEASFGRVVFLARHLRAL